MVTPLPTMAYGNWYVTLPRRPPKPAGAFLSRELGRIYFGLAFAPLVFVGVAAASRARRAARSVAIR
jgi:hypothetical protein